MSNKKLTLLNEEVLGISAKKDKLRDFFGSWTYDASGMPTYSINNSSVLTFSSVKKDTQVVGEEFKKDRYTVELKYSISTGMLDGGEVYSNQNQQFLSILSAIGTDTFEDFSSEIQVPAIDGEDLQAKVSYEYNFYDKAYEDELFGTTTSLVEIPSIYGMAYDAGKSESLAAQNNYPTADLLSFNKRQSSLFGGYGKHERQMVIGNPSETIGKWEENKDSFPMYTKIDVPYGRERRIANDLQESFLAAAIMRDLAEEENLDSRVQDKLKLFLERGDGTTSGFDLVTDSIDLLTYWLNDVGVWGAEPPQLPSTSMFISQEGWNQEQQNIADPSGDFFITPATGVVLLRGKLDLILEDHGRTFDEIMAGKLAHSEIVMYKISKFLGSIGNVPVQEFYFYNSGEEGTGTVQSFIDSQVKYDEEYSYVVTGYCAIVGSTYNYGAAVIGEDTIEPSIYDSSLTATMEVTVEPTIRLYEVPIFASTGKIFMQAPHYPQSNIEQIKGYTKGMLFSFDTQVGQMYDVPVSLTTREEEYYNQLLNDPLKSKDGLILYHSSDAMSGVQIYRVDVPPSSYEDFKGSLVRVLRTDVDLASSLTAAAVAKIVNQPANKKFYYMFRSLGPHDEPSNPSPVYQIELHNDAGVAYPIVRLHEFEKSNRKQFTKSMKNLIRISPKITQALVNEQASGLKDENGVLQAPQENSIVLGLEEEPLFGKTFKIRITSKDTGKKIDLNITFKTSVVKSNTDNAPTGYVPPVIEGVAAQFGNDLLAEPAGDSLGGTSAAAGTGIGTVAGPSAVESSTGNITSGGY